MGKLQDIYPQMVALAEKFSGRVSFTFWDTTAGERVDYSENQIMPTASVIKIYALGTVFHLVEQGKLSLDDELEVTKDLQVGGSGVLKLFTPGLKIRVRDLLILMIAVSDNSATNIVIDHCCNGLDTINQYIESLGLKDTKFGTRVEFRDEFLLHPEGFGYTTSAEVVDYLYRVRHSHLYNEENTKEFMRYLCSQQFLDQIPRWLPYDPYARDLNGRDPDVQVANKTGMMAGVRADVGYLWRNGHEIVYGAFSDRCADKSFFSENEGTLVIAQLGKLVYDSVLA